ncbi:MAG: carboxypeptidase-like regulatory domain-containing protein, partial [Bacillota bacterium]
MSGWEFEPESRTVNSEESNLDFTGQNMDYDVSGKITDDNGDPISNVNINFSNGSSSVTTGTNGEWSKSGLGGLVTITPEKEGYIFTPGSEDVTDGRDDVDFTGSLEEDTYNISGKIEDQSDAPLEGVVVRFNGGYSSVTTDENGEWTKEEVSGEITVTPEMSGWEFEPESRTVNSEESNLDFTGQNMDYDVSGVIIYSNGEGVPGVLIEFYRDGDLIETAVTKDDGTWDKANLWGTVNVKPDPDSKDGVNSFLPENQIISSETDNVDFIAQ